MCIWVKCIYWRKNEKREIISSTRFSSYEFGKANAEKNSLKKVALVDFLLLRKVQSFFLSKTRNINV